MEAFFMNGTKVDNPDLAKEIFFTDEGAFVPADSVSDITQSQIRNVIINGINYDCTKIDTLLGLALIYEQLSRNKELNRLEEVVSSVFPQYSFSSLHNLEMDLLSWSEHRLMDNFLDDRNVKTVFNIAENFGFIMEGRNDQFFITYEKQLISGFSAYDCLSFADALVDAQMKCYLDITSGKKDYGPMNKVLINDYSDFAGCVQEQMLNLSKTQTARIERFSMENQPKRDKNIYQHRVIKQITGHLFPRKSKSPALEM